MATQTSEAPRQYLGVEFFTESDLETVQALNPPPGTRQIIMQAQGNSIIWHPGADAPAVGNGFVALPLDLVCIHQDHPEDVRVIRGSVGASLFVSYSR